MPAEEINLLVRRYVELFNLGEFEKIAEIFTPDVVFHGVLGQGGLDFALPIWRDLHHAFGTRLEIRGILTEGDEVAVRYTESGTFRNPFRGMDPTRRSYSLDAIEWLKIRDHKIAARWGVRDSGSMMRQLGAN